MDALENQRPDTIPGQPDLQHQPGNYVRLNCGGKMILLAHLRQGSVVVSLGERFFSGQLIAEVGNSGNSLEPHLHVDVADNGMELAISFDGRPALINALFSVNGK
ncbi:M23 family metallopeptidase [Thiomicrorhabdus heinhorstiae]|uniref:M23 family metallopeptidase n=1 Tax=Thiomicrorhabdus heinhorstiae TaxID=2748010 RepID=UPI002B4B1E1D|nr:M23 family metallopeptidase [Thiomicrorhabdus heinhorstiae]